MPPPESVSRLPLLSVSEGKSISHLPTHSHLLMDLSASLCSPAPLSTRQRVLFQTCKMRHVTPLFKTLQWLPFALGIKSQTLTKTHRALPDHSLSLHPPPPRRAEIFQGLPAPWTVHILLSPFDHSFPKSSYGRCPLIPQASSSKATSCSGLRVPEGEGLHLFYQEWDQGDANQVPRVQK